MGKNGEIEGVAGISGKAGPTTIPSRAMASRYDARSILRFH